MALRFDNTYSNLPAAFFTALRPVPVASPSLIKFNDSLAQILGVSADDFVDIAATFSGNSLPKGASPLAQLYAGHQFGHWTPQLGDGRAILLGEIIGVDGKRRDLQLKGSGPTPYSRSADGRAWLGPVLREYLVSEAMYALGIPTTRALAAVKTSEPVYRETGALPGAILTRVASSHLRVGTFQIFAARGDVANLKRLTEYAISRHYPEVDGPLGLLCAVCQEQAKLIAQWMAVGFIHGVMNTDNCTISGETIDYGPCAFMDVYHPDTVYSSIDHFGRYAYSNQPKVILWNLAQFGSALIQQFENPKTEVEKANEIISEMTQQIKNEQNRLFMRKIGITDGDAKDIQLVTQLLEMMTESKVDFTNTFVDLTDGTEVKSFADPTAFAQWSEAWKLRLKKQANPTKVMQAANPYYIPRNHRIEEVIVAALQDDFQPFKRLLRVLGRPFEHHPEDTDLRAPPKPHEVVSATFCGT
ncbi:MAG: YdiU family protein [Aestuariivita sp.]|nr:YdiU family protein [Aestuariivita sp.]MCY4201129.1 YdiU family protein [Aestuariivita sp.]MCY4287794.1 YdiU family protein [Aestuariivita sp.]MCY4345960.1 YdiU family protein [Aestuariivita sp.]